MNLSEKHRDALMRRWLELRQLMTLDFTFTSEDLKRTAHKITSSGRRYTKYSVDLGNDLDALEDVAKQYLIWLAEAREIQGTLRLHQNHASEAHSRRY